MKIIYKDEYVKLIQGDCIKVMDIMIDKKYMVDCSIVDIPYGNVSKNGEERAKYTGQLRKINKEEADIVTFDEIEFSKRLAQVTKGSIYIFCGIDQIAKIYNYFKDNLKKDWMARLCTWHKTNPSPSNGQHMYLSASEFIIFAKRRNTIFNGHCEHNVFNFPCGRSKLHPTEKPQQLLEYLIKMSSNEGDEIFDCCFGSGSTALASKNLGRKFLGVELQEKYCEVAKQRLQNIKITIN
ncbi:MAG TPA: site-specific DNA-methyltransferase [Gallicola sp.]|nr:site-specific DNA-methyltransferase [Gallicola sp.]